MNAAKGASVISSLQESDGLCSVGGFFKDGVETHHALLEAGIWIIEGLNLSGIAPGIYELICLPLRIEGGDGAPSRALLRSVEATANEEEGKTLCL